MKSTDILIISFNKINQHLYLLIKQILINSLIKTNQYLNLLIEENQLRFKSVNQTKSTDIWII